MKYRILLFYKYTKIEDTAALLERERSVCSVLGLKGRIIVAEEGINGTLEGTYEDTQKYIDHLKSDKRFRSINFKESEGTGKAFPKLMARVRKELVGQRFDDKIDPIKRTGKYLDPSELHKWYKEDKDDFVIVDMRSKYETAVGIFDKTIDIEVDASREIVRSKALDEIKRLQKEENKKIVTVCTGGVKCEKMSAYLLDQGIDNVWQLHNGIHAYMQKFPAEDFKGALYTFDGRVTMDFGDGKDKKREVYGKCVKCSAPSETFYDIHEEGKRLGNESHVIMCDDCAEASEVVEHRSDVLATA